MRAAMAWIIAAGMLAVAPAGCGSSVGSTCGRAKPCGGDIVGRWTVRAGCADQAVLMAELQAQCPGANVRVLSSSAEGTMTFNADGTLDSSFLTSTTFGVTAALGCISATAASCGELTRSNPGIVSRANYGQTRVLHSLYAD